MNQKLMVVVKYDLFPHMLVFDVAQLEPKGVVYVKDCGHYPPESVLAIVPHAEGMAIKARLQAMEGDVRRLYEKACDERKEALFKDFPAIRRIK